MGPHRPVCVLMAHNGEEDKTVVLTDGGQHPTVDENQAKELEQLFVEVTGTDTVTESQQSPPIKRGIAEQKDRTLSGYVAEITQNDGLDETLPEVETGSTD